MKLFDRREAVRFVGSMCGDNGAGFRSVRDGPVTLYGTCYALLTRHYLADAPSFDARTRDFISNCQLQTGEFIGPELESYEVPKDAVHDREHLIYHLTCAALPCCLQFGIPIHFPLSFAHHFCDRRYLAAWLNARDLTQAWFEGNNILFVGQLLVYLRDVERHPDAAGALECWFDWLDSRVDVATGLWGTNGYCGGMEAVYGGYHQLLVYYHEDHRIPNPRGLVDTVLSLQHEDGGFHPNGNGGACEDVDCVDILVNTYKRFDYRRDDIRRALRRCSAHIVDLQNPDGGFPYNRDCPQAHMGIPATRAPANTSTVFATWFRVHTLALISQCVPDEPSVKGVAFRFSENLSMGWHRTWSVTEARQMAAAGSVIHQAVTDMRHLVRRFVHGCHRVPRMLYHAGRRRAGRYLGRKVRP